MKKFLDYFKDNNFYRNEINRLRKQQEDHKRIIRCKQRKIDKLLKDLNKAYDKIDIFLQNSCDEDNLIVDAHTIIGNHVEVELKGEGLNEK